MYGLSLVGSVFIACFSFPCWFGLFCSWGGAPPLHTCGLFSRDAVGCIYGGTCSGIVGSPCSSAYPPQSLLHSLMSITRTCWEAPAVPLLLVKSARSASLRRVFSSSQPLISDAYPVYFYAVFDVLLICVLFVYSILIYFSLVDSSLYYICCWLINAMRELFGHQYMVKLNFWLA